MKLLQYLQQKIKSNPTGLYVLFYTEMWELFGRFGITALLVLYLTQTFHIADARAFSIYAAFIALIFATPIIGGVLADRYLGSRFAIILGACLMIVGDAMMVIPKEFTVFLGLSIVAVGSGFFLPSIPPLVGALYEKDEGKRDAGFTLYYLGKNLGALLAPIACGFVGEKFGMNYAFVLSTIGMISGVTVFTLGHKHLKGYNRKPRFERLKHKILGLKPLSFVYLVMVLMVPIVYLVLIENIDSYLLVLTITIVIVLMAYLFLKSNAHDRKRLVLIFIGLLAVIVFEAFLGQGGTTLNLFIQRIIDRNGLGFSIPTSAFYALDPVFMLITGPFLAGYWMHLARKKKEPVVTTKFAFAMFLLAAGFLVFTEAAHRAMSAASASPLFVVLAYFLFPVAELCIIPISLSLVTKVAPKGMDSLLVGIWMLSNAVSSFFTGEISKLGQVDFSLNSHQAIMKASHIYQRLFFETAVVLAVTGVVLLLLQRYVKKLLLTDGEVERP